MLSFYANSIHFKNGKVEYDFTRPNIGKQDASIKDNFVHDSEQEKRYNKEVYCTVTLLS